ncbi:MAG: tetratricopeptide repeat protein [Candidatus Obscuribacterales bacterium]|nr:tetratricopeptide repeat protein [Candidatus Obscuribacterales bacterium]
MKSPIGTIFAEKFEILSLLGQGGMSVVYKARHTLTDRIVAIKLLSSYDMPSLKRFQQEAKLACTLNHPYVISVFDFGVSADGQPFLVMDYLEGITLAESIKKDGAMAVGRALGFFIQGCDALAYAHRREVLHRDLKPGNFMITRDHEDHEVLKLVDFGIAKHLSPDAEALDLTRTGEVFGSPLYMSPEQCLGRKLDARADIYSMGCVMYEVLTGVPPLVGANAIDTLHKHINEDPEPFSDARSLPENVPPHLENIIFKALSREIESRYQTMQEMLNDLSNFKQKFGSAESPEEITGPQPNALPSLKLASGLNVGTATTQGDTAVPPNVQSSSTASFRHIPTIPPSGAPSAKSHSNHPPIEAMLQHDSNKKNAAMPKLAIEIPHIPSRWHKFAPLAVAVVGAMVFIAIYTIVNRVALFSGGGSSTTAAAGVNRTVSEEAVPGQKVSGEQFDDKQKSAEEAYENGRYDIALVSFEALVKTARRDFEPGDPRLAETLHNLGNAYFKQDQLDEAEKTLTEAMSLQSKQGETTALADTMTDIALVYCAQGQFKKAETSLNKALNIHLAKSGANSDDVADCKTALANLHIKQGRVADAMKELKESLNIRQKEKDPSLYDLANTENVLATDYQLQHNLTKARSFYQSAMKNAQQGFGPNHPLVSDSLVGLGTIDFLENNLGEAESYFQRALKIRENTYGKNNLRTAEVLACEAILKEHQGKYLEAKPLLAQALSIKKDVLGSGHPEVARTQENYNSLLKHIEKAK